MNLGMVVGLGPGYIVLDEDPAPPKGAQPSLQFSVHVPCSQTAGWITMPLGMEVGLGPGDIVLDGDPAPLPKTGEGHKSPPIFGLCIVAKRLDESRCPLVRR